jgi:hypothetical protein
MKPLQISPETALKLAKALNVPVEHLMHTPPHILMQKLAELARQETAEPSSGGGSPSADPATGKTDESEPRT